MSTKQKILEGINKLSEKDVEDQFGSGEGICIQLDEDSCIIISKERYIN